MCYNFCYIYNAVFIEMLLQIVSTLSIVHVSNVSKSALIKAGMGSRRREKYGLR